MSYINIEPETGPVTPAVEDILEYSEPVIPPESDSPSEPDYEFPPVEPPLSERERKQEYWPFLEEPTARNL